MNPPKVSVIVPVYKAEKYLHRCVDSILAQTFTDFEVLLIDDGSPDRSGEICDEYAKKDSRVRVFHKENGGVSSARNVGLKEAKGEWITFSDSDDEMLPDALSIYMQIARKESDIDVIKCGYIKHKEPEHSQIIYRCEEEFISSDKSIVVQVLNNSSSYHGFLWNECIKKSCIDGLVFDEAITWNEDNLFSYQCFLIARKIAISPQLVYLYKIREGMSLSNVKNPYFVINTSATIFRYRLDMLANKNNVTEVKKQFVDNYVNMFHYSMKILSTNKSINLNEFRAMLKYKDILSKDIAARLFLSNLYNANVAFVLYKIARKIILLMRMLSRQ